LGSVAGGGRYDTLIELCGGRPTPATGISLGMERIFEILSRRGLFPSPKSIRVFVASADESVRSKATRVAQMLRRSQIPADLDLANRRLSAQLEYANKRGFAFTVIVGKRELRRGEVVVRNMVTKSQRNVKLDELPGIIKGLI
ncbi:MAG: His/Gly/Thr/Pro-type tRNA ligase C-terminal domain-containing protein, partial [Candidatus Bathyarchaeia archaeon]